MKEIKVWALSEEGILSTKLSAISVLDTKNKSLANH